MENSSKARRPSSDKPHKTRNSDDARAQMHYNPRAPPHTSFLSGSPQVITSSPQITPQIIQGQPNGMYSSQPTAAWHANQLPPESYGYSRPPQPWHPSQNGYYPPAPYGPPGGWRPQSDSSPATRHPSRSFTHPTPGSNPVLPASRKASQFEGSRKVTVRHGHFAILTDTPLTQGDYSVVRGADEVDISGGQFVIGSTFHASAFLNDTAEAARMAFNKDKSTHGNNGRKLEEDPPLR